MKLSELSSLMSEGWEDAGINLHLPAVIDSIKRILREAGETTIELEPDYQAMIDNSPLDGNGNHVGQYGQFSGRYDWITNNYGHLTEYWPDDDYPFVCGELYIGFEAFIPTTEPVDLDPITLKPVKK